MCVRVCACVRVYVCVSGKPMPGKNILSAFFLFFEESMSVGRGLGNSHLIMFLIFKPYPQSECSWNHKA